MLNLKDFDSFPDSALVPITVFPEMMGIAISTAHRRASEDPTFPKKVKLGNRCARFRVGEIRAFMAGNLPAPAAPAVPSEPSEPKPTNRGRLAKGRHV